MGFFLRQMSVSIDASPFLGGLLSLSCTAFDSILPLDKHFSENFLRGYDIGLFYVENVWQEYVNAIFSLVSQNGVYLRFSVAIFIEVLALCYKRRLRRSL